VQRILERLDRSCDLVLVLAAEEVLPPIWQETG